MAIAASFKTFGEDRDHELLLNAVEADPFGSPGALCSVYHISGGSEYSACALAEGSIAIFTALFICLVLPQQDVFTTYV